MKHTDVNQVFDHQGNVISETFVEVISYPTAEESVVAAARLVVLPKFTADELKDEAAEQYAGLFPDWKPGVVVTAGEVYRWDGTLVQVIQGHTTQADWEPDVVPALFKIHRSPTAAVLATTQGRCRARCLLAPGTGRVSSPGQPRR